MNTTKIKWPDGLFVYDSESFGLDERQHGVFDVAIIHPATGDRTSWLFRPEVYGADPAAIRVNGLTREAWNSITMTEREWALCFEQWVRQRVPSGAITLVGRNPSFDQRMLTAIGERVGGIDGALFLALFHHRVLDLHGFIQGLALSFGWDFDTARIDDLYRRLGQQPEPRPHTALGGVAHAFDALERMVQMVAAIARRAADHEKSVEDLCEAWLERDDLRAKTKALFDDLGAAHARIAQLEGELKNATQAFVACAASANG